MWSFKNLKNNDHMCPERITSDVIKSNYKGAALSNNSEKWVKHNKKMQIWMSFAVTCHE